MTEKRKAQMREYNKAVYQKYVQEGICVDCHKAPAWRGNRCEQCWTKRAEFMKYRRNVDKEIGFCTKCRTALAQAGRTMCFACAVKESERHRQYYWAKKKKGEMTY